MSPEDRLNSLLLIWQERQAQGQDLSVTELCRACPELETALRERIRILQQMNQMLGNNATAAEFSPASPAQAETLNQQTAQGASTSQQRRASGAREFPTIPGYEILSELGKGGMGVVYRARQVSLNRLVALKMIRAGAQASPAELARFFQEAETIARLRHPHIVQVHEFGSHEEVPFFSLELVEGGSLADRLQREPLVPGQAAILIETLARAVQAAHEQGIVHRDLKPANVLLSGDGSPRITDFGLARSAGSELTVTGMVMGTPSYMPPEQAEGQHDQIGPPADIYALGAILYECLTGRPPFKGPSHLDTIRMVVDTEPVPPTRLQPTVPRDLETICLKCLQKEPGQRYRSALELAEDLRRFQAGETITARPASALERSWRWCRRNPAVAGLLGAVLVTLTLGVAVASFLALEAEGQRQRAESARAASAARAQTEQQARTEAEAARQTVVRQIVDLHTGSGLRAAEKQDHASALLWFTQAARLARGEPEREHLNRVRVNAWRQYAGTPLRVLTVPGFRPMQERYRTFEFHPCGQHLLVNTSAGTCIVWDLMSSKQLAAPVLQGKITAAAWAPEGNILALGRLTGGVLLCRFPDLSVVETLQAGSPVQALTFSPDGRYLAWGTNTSARVWEVAQHKFATDELPHPRPVTALAFNDRGTLLSTACRDLQGRVFAVPGRWPQDTRPLFGPVPHHSGDLGVAHRLPWAPTFLPRGRGLLTITDRQRVVWREADTGNSIRALEPPYAWHAVTGVTVSPDGQRLALLHVNGCRLWDLTTDTELTLFEHQHGGAEEVAFDPTSERLVTAGHNTLARFWLTAVAAGRPLENWGHPLRHPGLVVQARFAPVGPVLATAQWDGQVVIWRLPAGPTPQFVLGTDGFSRIALSADGRHFLLAGISYKNGSLGFSRVYRTDDGLPAGPRFEPTGLVLDGLFTPDGQTAILASTWSRWQKERNHSAPSGTDGFVELWDWQRGQRRCDPLPMPSEPRGLAINATGSLACAVCASGPVVLFEPTTGRILHQLDSGIRTARYDPNLWWSNGLACFTADGSRLATWEKGHSVQLWDPQTGKLLHHLPHEEQIHEAVFSPDGRLLSTASRDRKARVWAAGTGKLLAPPLVHPQLVVRARFLPQEGEILTLCDDALLRRWNWRTGKVLASFSVRQFFAQDLAFIRAGQGLISAALSGVAAFDLPTGTALTPELAGSHNSQTLSVQVPPQGNSVITGGLMWHVLGHDLGTLLRPAQEDAASLLNAAELTAGVRVDERGSLVPLTPEEWLTRWHRQPVPPLSAWPGAWTPTPGGDRPADILLADRLHGKPAPTVGQLLTAEELPPAPAMDAGVALDSTSVVEYALERFPAVQYTLSLWMRTPALVAAPRLELLSCYRNGQPSPLRLSIEDGCLQASCPVGRGWKSGRVRLPTERWVHVAVVRSGRTLALCLDGQPRRLISVPRAILAEVDRLRLQGRAEQPWKGAIRVAEIQLEEQALSLAELSKRASAKPEPP